MSVHHHRHPGLDPGSSLLWAAIGPLPYCRHIKCSPWLRCGSQLQLPEWAARVCLRSGRYASGIPGGTSSRDGCKLLLHLTKDGTTVPSLLVTSTAMPKVTDGGADQSAREERRSVRLCGRRLGWTVWEWAWIPDRVRDDGGGMRVNCGRWRVVCLDPQSS